MKNRLLKQNIFSVMFLGGFLFSLDLSKIYLNFSSDQFKLSLSEWLGKLIPLFLESFTCSIVVLVPITIFGILASLINIKWIKNCMIFLNQISFFVISSYLLFIFSLILLLPNFDFDLLKIPEQLRTLNLNLQLYLVSIPLVILLLSLLIFKKVKKQEKQNVLSLVGLSLILVLSLYQICFLKVTNKKLNNLKTLISKIKYDNKPKSKNKDINYKESFIKYLGLESLYESEENYIRLLSRKTSKKLKELNVTLIYVADLKEEELNSFIQDELYTFDKLLLSSSSPKKALRDLKLNIPIVGKGNLKNLKEVPTYFEHPLNGYKVSIINEIKALKNSERLDFNIVNLSKMEAKDYKNLNKIIEQNKENTIFVFCSASNGGEGYKTKRESQSINFGFVSFLIPRGHRPNNYDQSKVIGQEDIMTTIYNLALSKRDYISLGDDIFNGSESNGINEDTYIDKRGYIKDGMYISFNKEKKSLKNDERLARERYEAIKNISAFILLRSTYK